jgi:transglutaminase-like putative cysteine protease
MARLKIVHTTEYTYRNPVGFTRHRLMVRPDDSHDLRLHHSELIVEPEPAYILWKHDVFDNSICLVEWPEELRAKRLLIVSSLDLTHHPDGEPLPQYSIDPSAEFFPFSYSPEELPDLVHLIERRTPDRSGKVDAWARRTASQAKNARTLSVLGAMTHAIKEEFRYDARHEEGTQTAVETIERGTGTCRDFAVLMMEALRSFGLAARFVTGYLYDEVVSDTRGGGNTHAWCSVYLPGAGWIEYDPTNGLLAGSDLIRVGVTRDAFQAIPILGGYIGSSSDAIGLRVDVSVNAISQGTQLPTHS